MSSCGNDADSSVAVEGRAEAIMSLTSDDETRSGHMMITCPSCNHPFKLHGQCQIHKLSGLLAGVKFDPTDREILEYLEAKIKEGVTGLHPLINEFIPTIEGDSGICYTHPEMLPGMTRDGQIRHFFHRTSKAHKTGTRKLRKVHTGVNNEGTSRWHRTGRIKPVLIDGNVKGFKKIFVLRTNLSGQSKLEKTTWVMHQYHLGDDKEEKDGEFVISKVFYQTQSMQCETKNDDKEMEATSSSTNGQSLLGKRLLEGSSSHNQTEGCPESISCDQDGGERERTGLVTLQLFPIPALERDDES